MPQTVLRREAEPRAPADHYRHVYREQLDDEADWLRRSARPKVDSIELLLRRAGIRPRELLELGCGTGAVIGECQRRDLALAYRAIDYAPEAVEHVRRTTGIPAQIADITAPDLAATIGAADVVVLTHVLEHLVAPEACLKAIRRCAISFAIFEVPLENLPVYRLKVRLFGRNPSTGHINFYTQESFRRLVQEAGFTIIDERIYAPVLDRETLRMITARNRMRRARKAVCSMTNRYLPMAAAPLWTRLYYGHHALLCR